MENIKLKQTIKALNAYKVLRRELDTRFEHVSYNTARELIIAMDNAVLRVEEAFSKEMGMPLDAEFIRATVRKLL